MYKKRNRVLHLMSFDIGLLLAVATAIVSVLGWYRSQIRTSFTQERETTHILNNLEQASLAHQDIFKQLDSVDDRLSRLEVILLSKRGDRNGN